MARDTRRIVILGTAILLVTGAVGGVLLSGWLDSGDEGPGALDAEVVPQVDTPPPKAEGGTSVVPSNVTVPPEPPLQQPTHIEIKGRLVALAPGMRFGRGAGTGDGLLEPGATPPPTPAYREVWDITYDSNPQEIGYSKVTFDENYNALTVHIRPEDEEEFQPIVDALAAP